MLKEITKYNHSLIDELNKMPEKTTDEILIIKGRKVLFCGQLEDFRKAYQDKTSDMHETALKYSVLNIVAQNKLHNNLSVFFT